MLSGEITRRRHDNQNLAKQPINELLSSHIKEKGGPLIWPQITETAQRAFDATLPKAISVLSAEQSP